MAIVYLNGEFLDADKACVSVLDRGFIFGDGVYEVIPAYGGRLFRLEEHLRRLQNSLNGIGLQNPLSITQWTELLTEVLERNACDGDCSVYFQVTRGAATRDHIFPEKIVPTVYIMANPMPTIDIEQQAKGVSAILTEDIRWRFCNIKAIALLPNILLRQQAREAGAYEALLHRDGIVTEGAASNLFIVLDNKIMTPKSSEAILPGITRDLILEIGQADGLDCHEADISVAQLQSADEIWITSSTKEILPIVELDNEPVGKGKAGPQWRKMLKRYQDYKQKLREGTAN